MGYTKERAMVWRLFRCIRCENEKRNYMAERDPAQRPDERQVDFRQFCPTCRKICQHIEIIESAEEP